MSVDEVASTEKDTIIEIAIDAIRVSPFQPRRVFSNEELDELIASLKSVGLIHPPVVREIRNGEHVLYYELIAGERRWRAMQKAGYAVIPVVLKRMMADDVAAEATLIENIQRVNLNPLEMAEAFKKLIHVFGLTQDKVASKVGKKRSTVANYLRLLTLSETIQKSISLGEVTLGHAKVILTLEDPALREQLNAEIIKEGLAVREAELLAKSLMQQHGKQELVTKGPKEKTSYPHPKEKYAEVQKRLSNECGYKVKVQPSGEDICVSFYLHNAEELETLQARLLKDFPSSKGM